MADYMQQLKENGATGLDLSPGDPAAKWAHETITELRARIAQLEQQLEIQLNLVDQSQQQFDSVYSRNVSLTADNAGLREENARLRGPAIEYPRVYGPGDAARGAKS